MSDSKKPKPSQQPILPRTWKATPEPEPEPPVASKKAKGKSGPDDPAAKPSKKGKKAKPGESGDEAPASKLEETPLLDTYEARRTVRIVVGAAMSLVGLIAIIVLVRMFQPGPPGPDAVPDKKEARTTIDSKESSEREAAVFVENAKKADKDGKTPVAIVLLQKVTRNYEGTEAAREANAALDRDRRNRPLFEVDAAKNPTGPVPPSTTRPSDAASVANVPGATASPIVVPPKAPEIVARPLPSGFHPDPSSKIQPSGWHSKIICERDGAALVLVPAGEFLMGRDDGDASERPSHWVRLTTYYIDEHEVTNRQYQFYLRESGRPLDIVRQTATETPESIAGDKLDLPAVGLTARDARSYCVWANRRLPTEAQWEMAARSSDGRVSYGMVKEAAKGDQPGRTLEPVMTTPNDRSPFGAFDLAANAWEWTSDYYDPSYYNQFRGISIDPAGPTQSRIKPPQVTVKGGSKLGLLTWREGLRIEAKMPLIGFRGVLPVELPATPPPSAQPSGPGVNPPGGVIPF